MGEIAVALASDTDTIETGGIGSCVVITLYDAEAKIGGMAHAMLPTDKATATHTEKPPAKYVDEAIDALVAETVRQGAKQGRLKAKIVGGARMFHLLSGENAGIGFQNAEIAKKHLIERGIQIENEDVGGTVGRNACLQLSNGLLSVNTTI